MAPDYFFREGVSEHNYIKALILLIWLVFKNGYQTKTPRPNLCIQKITEKGNQFAENNIINNYLVYWSFGLLVYWFIWIIGLLVYWFIGLFVYSFIHWVIGLLVYSFKKKGFECGLLFWEPFPCGDVSGNPLRNIVPSAWNSL